MAYQDQPGGGSWQPFTSNPSGYAAPPAYQAAQGYMETPAGQHASGGYSSNRKDSYDSAEDRSDPELEDGQILSQATEFTRRVPPPAYIPLPLLKPVTVPQTMSGTGQPFARCWSPALIPYAIPPSDFVEFIDNLNVVATANPPLQILDLAGGMLGMVPHHIFQLAGTGLQAAAKLGTVVVSKKRTDMYMDTVNKDFFTPRGLKATIMSREAMAVTLRLPGNAERLAPITNENINHSVLERRLEGMKPYMSELRLDVPPPAQQTTLLAKMSAGQVKRQSARAEKKALKQRHKQMERLEKEDGKVSKDERKDQKKYDKEMKRLDKDTRKVEKDVKKQLRKGRRSSEEAERELREELSKIEEKKQKANRDLAYSAGDGASSSSSSSSISKAEKKDKESKQAMKALWIVIENLSNGY